MTSVRLTRKPHTLLLSADENASLFNITSTLLATKRLDHIVAGSQ